jgi:hypothetical protein
MSDRKFLTAAIAAVREVEGGESETQPQAVSELFAGELGAVKAIGRGGEPRPGLLSPEQPTLGK